MAMPATRHQPTKYSRSFRVNPIILDLTNEAGIIDNSIMGEEDKLVNLVPPSPTHSVILPPGKILRRKNNMSIVPTPFLPAPMTCDSGGTFDSASTSPSPRSPHPVMEDSISQPGNCMEEDSPCPPFRREIDASRVHQRSQSQPANTVKLGHPARPYYTAIRPRPTSVIGLSPSLPAKMATTPPPTRPSSLVISPPDAMRFTQKQRSFLDVQIQDGDVVLPTPSVLSPPASQDINGSYAGHLPFGLLFSAGEPGAGRSASGETEMRMASNHQQGGLSYSFTEKDSSGTHSSVRTHVRRWSRGLRGFFHKLGDMRTPAQL